MDSPRFSVLCSHFASLFYYSYSCTAAVSYTVQYDTCHSVIQAGLQGQKP
jgi:hypothetical protein